MGKDWKLCTWDMCEDEGEWDRQILMHLAAHMVRAVGFKSL